RIAQEAMTNVERHAGARKVELELARDECRVRLRVTDDGRGFDPRIIDRPELDGLGLRSIRQRVEEQTGTFRLRSRPGFTELAIDFGHGRPA
ncbi:MAG TPA: ATP-binding protein, partial [Polyangiaceae bacterium]|nr:ATP-binding protein [Polyangiaceae bacterium]